MSTHVNTIPPVRNWRDIQQAIAPKAMSSEGRKRLQVATAKTVAVLFALGLVGWGLFEGMRMWEQNPMAIQSPVKSAPVKFVDARSDGVLDHGWVTRTLALPKTVGLMELDLYALRNRLLESGQVRTAVLTRKFPERRKDGYVLEGTAGTYLFYERVLTDGKTNLTFRVQYDARLKDRFAKAVQHMSESMTLSPSPRIPAGPVGAANP